MLGIKGVLIMYVDENKRKFLRIKFKIDDDISNLQKLSELIEDAIKRECSSLSEQIEAEKANRSQDEKDYLVGWYEMSLFNYKMNSPDYKDMRFSQRQSLWLKQMWLHSAKPFKT